MLVEKQDAQNQHWEVEEKNYNCELEELERDGYAVKRTHKKVMSCDGREVKSHFDEFPPKSIEEVDPRSKPKPANTNRFVVQNLPEDKSFGKLAKASDLDAAPGLRQGPKECTASKPRKKRRPQSLNLGGAAKLICRNGDTDSSSAGEESQGSYLDNAWEQISTMTENHCEEQDQDGSESAKKGDKQEHPSIGGISERRESPPGPTVMDPGYPEPSNGPEKPGHDGLLVGLKEESARKIQRKGLILDKELAEVKLRQVRTHERRVGSFGGEDTEGLVGRTSLRRLSGGAGGSNYPGEITRIVPLKPERSKSVACKDERDKAGPEELSSRFLRRDYRWSVGSSVEGATDFHWSEAHDSNNEAAPQGRCRAEGQSLASKISLPPKIVPPAPPVKTQKARESGLILRNSRSAGRDPGVDAAKKRHSVTLPSSASAFPSNWNIQLHCMSFQAAPPNSTPWIPHSPAQLHTMLMFFMCPHSLSCLSGVGTAIKKLKYFFALPPVKHHSLKVFNISHWPTSDEQHITHTRTSSTKERTT